MPPTYTEDSAAFLRDLSTHNTRSWYRENQQRYRATLLEPSRAFVEALGATLRRRVHPGIVSVPKVNKAIRRLARDTRFTRDKTPFRTEQQLILSWSDRRFAPGFQVFLRPDGVEVAAGRHGWDAPQTKGFRAALMDHRGPGFVRSLAVCEASGFTRCPPQAKGTPRGVPRGHEYAELLRYRTGFTVHKALDVALTCPDLVERCADALILTGPLVAWIDANARTPQSGAPASSIALTDAACALAEDGP